MIKPIAILSSNLELTIQWAVNELNVTKINLVNRRLTGRNSTGIVEYVMIFEHEQCLSWEFSDVIKAPDYYTLEDAVRQRIR